MAAGVVDHVGRYDQLSLKDHYWLDGTSHTVPDHHYMSVPGVGYGNTAATFAEPFASKIIRLGAKVTQINYKDLNNAIISFTANGVEQEIATTVLVTVSLGVLKARTINFIPSLPKWKQDAIDNMGFGRLNKCAMQWNDPNVVVWPNEKWFHLITPGDNASSEKWRTFYNPTEYKDIPTIVGFVGGQNSIDMEAQTDEEVLNDVMKNLNAMFPTLGRPNRVVITRWGKEPNVRGSYSFHKAGRNFGDDSSHLQQNVGHLYFAGEATAGTYWWASVVGAWKTGEKAARKMFEAISKAGEESSAESVNRKLRGK